MSRSFDFVVVGVIWMVAIVIHLMGVELFSPGTPLYEMGAGASNLQGSSRAELWSEMLIVWVPLLSGSGIIAWAFIREYRRQAVTAGRRVQP